jgi:hypothetical protein
VTSRARQLLGELRELANRFDEAGLAAAAPAESQFLLDVCELLYAVGRAGAVLETLAREDTDRRTLERRR